MSKKIELRTMDKRVMTTLYFDNREVIHTVTKMRFKPTYNKSSWKSESNKVREVFEGTVERILKNTKVFSERFLCNIDISDGNLSQKKWSRLKFEIFVVPVCEEEEESVSSLEKISNTVSMAVINTLLSLKMELKEL